MPITRSITRSITKTITRPITGRVTTDPDFLAYRTLAENEGGSFTSSEETAYNNFIIDGKANGWYDHLLEIYPFHRGDLNVAKIKLKAGSGKASTLTPVGFGDADVLASGGLQGATGKYFNTGYNYNEFTSGLGGLAFWVGDERSGGVLEWIMGAGNSATPQATIDIDASNTLYGRWGSTNSSQYATLSGPIQPGLYHVARRGLSELQFIVNGVVSKRSTGTTTTGTRARDISVFTGGAAGSVAYTGKGFFAAIDDGLMTDSELKAYGQAVIALMLGLGRIEPETGNLESTVLIGQSLATGAEGNPALSTSSVYPSLTMATGVRSLNPSSNPAKTNDQMGALKLLVEKDFETISSGFANTISKWWRDNGNTNKSKDMYVSCWGKGATDYDGLKKGTLPYENSLDALTFANEIKGLYRTGGMIVPGILCVHGESDAADTGYQAEIETWQSDYQTDINAITGRSDTIPIFHSQHSSWTSIGNLNAATAVSPYEILDAYEANPTKTVLVCAKYFLNHVATAGVHLDNAGYRLLGEYYAKAWYQHIIEGTQWSPLRPLSISRTGSLITITFDGRVGNLVLDTTSVTDPGNYGFEWDQTGGTAQTISSVALANSDTEVQITLTGDPGSPSSEFVRYAYTGTPGSDGGPTSGPRGCVRDSDTTQGYSGTALPNWLIHFSKPVGFGI